MNGENSKNFNAGEIPEAKPNKVMVGGEKIGEIVERVRANRRCKRIFEEYDFDSEMEEQDKTRGIAISDKEGGDLDGKGGFDNSDENKDQENLDEVMAADAGVREKGNRFFRSAKELLSNDEIRKQIGKTFVGTAASMIGVKGLYDVPMYLAQKYSVVKDKNEFGEIMGGLSKEGVTEEEMKNKRVGEIINPERIDDLERKIEDMNVPEDVKDKLMQELNEMVENYKEEKKELEEGKSKKLSETLDDYIKTKITGTQAVKEGLNTFLVASGAYGLRGVSYGLVDGVDRYLRLKKEYRQKGEKLSVIKDVIVGAIKETLGEASLKDKSGKKNKLQKGLSFIKAWGNIARYAGMGAMATWHPETAGDSLEMALSALQGKEKFGDVVNNYQHNAERLVSFYGGLAKKPIQSIWESFSDNSQHNSNASGVSKADFGNLPDKSEGAPVNNKFAAGAESMDSAEKLSPLESEPEILEKETNVLNDIYSEFEKVYEENGLPLGEKLDEDQLNYLVQSMRSKKIGAGDISKFLVEERGQNIGKVSKVISEVVGSEQYKSGIGGEKDDLIEKMKEVIAWKEKGKMVVEGFVAEKSIEQPKPLGLKNNFSLKLGEGKVPAQLERVFHMMSVDAMENALGADKIFGEEEGGKSLNVAANLVKLAEGKDVPGADVETFKEAVEWNSKTKELKIKNHEVFNEIIKSLHGHAGELWEKGVLQKGAAAYLDDIKKDTWEDIVKASGLEKAGEVETGIEGHDNIVAGQITDFEKSAMVEEAEKMMPREAPIAGEQVIEEIPEEPEKIDASNIVQKFSEVDLSSDNDVKEFLEAVGFMEMSAKEQEDALENLMAKAHNLDSEITKLKEINSGDLKSVAEEYERTKSLISFFQQKHEEEYGEKISLYNKILNSVQNEITEIGKLAVRNMEKRISEIYSYKFLFFKGSQMEEWQVLKDRSAFDIKNGNFGEPIGNAMDAAEQNNRLELQGYVDDAIREMKNDHKADAEPVGKETVNDFLMRYEEWKIMKNDAHFTDDVNKAHELGRELGYGDSGKINQVVEEMPE